MHSVQAVPGQTPSVILYLTHNLTASKIPEIRFDLQSTIEQVKTQIEKRYGSSADQMELILQDVHGNNVCNLGDDEKTLGFYNPQDNYTIYVIDKDPNSMLKGIDDVSTVDKYTISEEDYDKIQNNFRKWKKDLLENNPELHQQTAPVIIVEDDYQKDIADGIKIGDRCEVIETKHRGTVEYVGKIPNLEQGYYVGIRLDEPYGKHTGKFGTVQYFTCPDKYGLFLRPYKINVGEYPELDIDQPDEEDEL